LRPIWRALQEKGRLFFAVEEFYRKGIPEGETPSEYLTSWGKQFSGSERFCEAGKLIFALERLFKLRGLRYVDFSDIAMMIVHIPLQYIYQKGNMPVSVTPPLKRTFMRHCVHTTI
jgi:hypothetical protein